jgi:lysophospholipase L1-like esterase
VRFYKKDQPNSTFKSFIEANVDDPLVGWHPSPSGHEAWATELVRYIKENNLL